ncbi:vWA domain-containing protein [Halanaerobacter jeridensis]|uniref:Uncharacterized protein YegL n=1 Tax=Halanaerobacter jeridensis TaxID=706427 RepID=A0A938XU36_9FIRM|nr:VWA domain-containing protein [Halanaerobacter jeridensis]MBM7557791.1 uncharacterized protein YegL [Halanaerobacter jeridensis]
MTTNEEVIEGEGFGDELTTNTNDRFNLVFVVDTSGSMTGDIEELKQGLQTLEKEAKNDPKIQNKVRFAVVEFGGKVNVLHPFTDMANYQSPGDKLSAGGGTPQGQAVNLALEMIEEDKEKYRTKGIGYHRPFVVVLTDGKPNGEDFQKSVNNVVAAANQDKVVFFGLGVDSADMEKLKKYREGVKEDHKKNVRIAKVKNKQFEGVFKLLSNSMSSKSQSNDTEEQHDVTEGTEPFFEPA